MTREEMIDEAIRAVIGPFTMREMLKECQNFAPRYFRDERHWELLFIRSHFTRIAAREAGQ
jgi:hypothetical protein